MVFLILAIIILVFLIIIFNVCLMKNNNSEEYNQIEELKRRIDELDNDNVEVDPKSGKAKIIVPDIVDTNESTKTSTQSEKCKEYEVGPKQKVEKTVVGTNKKDEVFENTEIKRVENEEDDDPIKENNGIIAKLLKNNDE